jgi:hypothetical protein
VIHLVDAMRDSSAVLLACADAVRHLSMQGFSQSVSLVAYDGEASVRRASLLGLEGSRVVNPRHHARTPLTADAPRDARCVGVVWGSAHAASLVVLSEGLDDHLLVDVLLGDISLLSRGDEGERTPLPPDASLLDIGDAAFDERRDELRASLGLTDDDVLLMPLNDPSSTLDAYALAEISAMLCVAGRRVTTLVPRNARHADRAIRHWREGYVQRLLLTDDPIASFAPAADIAMLCDETDRIPYCSLVTIRHAHRWGVPVVVPGRHGERMESSASHAGIAIASGTSTASLASACMSLLEEVARDAAPRRAAGRTLADALAQCEPHAPTIGHAVTRRLASLEAAAIR